MAAKKHLQDMHDGQGDSLIDRVRPIVFRLDIKSVNVGKSRMIAVIIKKISMVSYTMLSHESIGLVLFFRNFIRELRI